MTKRAKRPSVYLAGPDVFLPNATEVGERKRALCTAAGLEGIFPLDNELALDGLPPGEQARRIAHANENLMRRADAIIANMTPFRGASMDAGTAFEVGFMRALGRPLFAYTNTGGDYARRARAARATGLSTDDFDAPHVDIEDFGLAENLMIAVAVSETGDDVVLPKAPVADLRNGLVCFKQAVDLAAAHFTRKAAP